MMQKRNNIFLVLSLLCSITIRISSGFHHVNADSVEQWDRFEISLNGPSDGNPFVDNELQATFTFNGNGDNDPFNVDGFYDGNGVYKVRFMPNQVGSWSYTTKSNVQSMDAQKGTFTATTASSNNHGPASVNYKTNRSFIFASGDPYFQTGTTTYAWMHQYLNIVNNTIKTFKYVAENNIFNKVRMTIFPKWYPYSHQEPIFYPYVGTPPNQWGNFDYFNVSFWQHLDYCLESVLDIERSTGKQLVADLIIFHPYDGGHWGFDCLGCPYPSYGTCSQQPNTYNTTNDVFYLKYLISRVASYRNVWWSMANEFDIVQCKSKDIPNSFPTWDTFFEAVVEYDPYRNPQKEKSIHNCRYIYNYSQPWTTHFSVQGYWQNTYEYFNNKYKVSKPVILDEVQYEGNITEGWCELNGPTETDRFWQAQTDGIYCGHSECFLPDNNDNKSGTVVLWWNFGNVLRGESYKRIGWFNNYMTNTSAHPRFDELKDKCLVSASPGVTCEVSQLYASKIYYLVHWTQLQSGYNMAVTINVENEDTYALSIVDYFGQTIKFVKNVNGPNISYTAPQRPFDIQIINTKSIYFS